MSIPKNLFLAWDNPITVPSYAKKVFEEAKEKLPNWNVVFYTSFQEMYDHPFFKMIMESIPFNLDNSKHFSANFLKTLQADLFRIYLFRTYGGIWIDCDARIAKEPDESIMDLECFLSETNYSNAGEELTRSNLDIFFMGMTTNCECLDLVEYFLEKDIKEEKMNFFYPMSFSNILERRGILNLNSRSFKKNYYFSKLPINYTREANNEKEKEDFYFCNFEEFPKDPEFYLKHYRITGGYDNKKNT